MWKSFVLSTLVLFGACAAGRAQPADRLVRDLVGVFEDAKYPPETRATALRALGALGWPARDDLPPLIKFLDDPDERKSARDTLGPYIVVIEAIGRLGPAARLAVPTLVRAKGIAAPYDQAIERSLESILVPTPGTAYALLTSLGDHDPTVRLLAVKTLPTYPVDYVVVAPLLRELAAKDADADVRGVARETLVLLTKAEVDHLVLLLKDPDDTARLLSARALGRMGADAAGAAKALQATADGDKDADVRAVARNALQKIAAKP
jgi:HEAT repeat protein